MRNYITDPVVLDPPRAPERPLFAVGDVHGHADALNFLLEHLRWRIGETYPDQDVDLVFLGDYIDRGPDPMGVFALLRQGLGLDNVRETTLMGNHDRFLMGAAQIGERRMDMAEWALWLSNGGRQTLDGLGGLSYAFAPAESVREALGPENVALLERLQLTFRSGDIFCVHAGVDPAAALADQQERDLIWIREPFLSQAEQRDGDWRFDVSVVHGHTPSAYGVFPHRIGVDTGGFHTGIFTAVELNAGEARFHLAIRN